MSKRVDGQAAYVLHLHPYSETSLVVDVFTREHGRVPLLARGARRPRSAMRGVLMSFQPLELGWFGGGEVKTLAKAEWLGGMPLLGITGVFGFYRFANSMAVLDSKIRGVGQEEAMGARGWDNYSVGTVDAAIAWRERLVVGGDFRVAGVDRDVECNYIARWQDDCRRRDSRRITNSGEGDEGRAARALTRLLRAPSSCDQTTSSQPAWVNRSCGR